MSQPMPPQPMPDVDGGAQHTYSVMTKFPFIASNQFKFDMIREWQDRMHPEVVSFLLCAVCA